MATLPTLRLIPTILARNTQKFSNVALYSFTLMIESLVVLPTSIVAPALQPSVERTLQFAQINTAIQRANMVSRKWAGGFPRKHVS